MSCAKKKEIPIQLLSATTPEGKMEYPDCLYFMPCLLLHNTKQIEKIDDYILRRQTNDANQTKQHLHILLSSSNI